MSLLDEIRKQPEHIRKIMFGLCSIVAISLIGLIWFRSFEKNLFVLMNPDEAVQQKYFAETGKEDTLFANLGKAVKDLKSSVQAAIGNIFQKSGSEMIIPSNSEAPANKIHPLPLSEEK